ncbi:peptidase G2 autoproteolytic cleavage domain-containing protein [Alkalihalobacillus trypoxylicola]|uniref:peptidase G2 autoproteolytic cleavage domain-containing protein n=1 Tax=Alkalihalobacillus trypoxylicola TaxID=519424 RepID=UPI0009ED0B6D|nr:peptidase G2 autoproteolytic cleavage domain-containing protein [Alkalihalobacillus trypoxylicola]
MRSRNFLYYRDGLWTLFSVVGQVYVRVTEDVQPMDIIKAYNEGVRTVSQDPTNVRVMQVTTPYDSDKGYGVAFCLLK